MLGVAAYQNDFGLFFNGIYTKVTDDVVYRQLLINTSSILSIDSLGASYKLYKSVDNKLLIEPYAGLRYTINSNRISIDNLFFGRQKIDWTDAIFGSRIDYNLSPSFNVIGSADYGIGYQSNSYNLTAFLGYQSPYYFKNCRFYLGYRFLHQNYHQGKSTRYFDWNMDLLGPVMGVLFKF